MSIWRCKYGLFQRILVRWSHLRPDPDPSGQNKADAWPRDGTSGVQRCRIKCRWYLQPLVDFAGAGASVPLIGFGHVLWEGMKKAIEEDGILGLFTGGFTACAAGVSSALIFSYLASFFFRPKMKK